MPKQETAKEVTQHRVVENDLIQNFDSPQADAILRLQTNIDFASLDKKITCYAVTSAQEAEGKTPLACNLALVYAEKGMKVALLDLDLRKPSIHKLFGFQNEVGIVEYVKGDVDSLNDIVHTSKGVDVISAGSYTPFPGKILTSPRMTKLLDELKKEYDYVILDTPPVLAVSDAFLIGQQVDGFLFVCAQHVSKKKDVAAGIKALTDKNINVLGIAMTMVTTDEDSGKGGYGGYGYRRYGKNTTYEEKAPFEKTEASEN